NPPAANLDPAFFEDRSFKRLAEVVQASLRVVLGHDPRRAGDVAKLIAGPGFSQLSSAEQRALLTPPSLDRLDLLFAITAQLEVFPSADTQRALLALSRTAWFSKLDGADRLRAVKVIAYASGQLPNADTDGGDWSQKRIIKRSLDALLGK